MPARVTNEIATAVMRAAKLRPKCDYPGSKVKWPCECLECGADVEPIYNSVQQNGRGCNPCGIRRRVQRMYIDQNVAADVMRAAGAEPQEPYQGSDVPWQCQCMTCKRTISPTHHNVQNGQGACAFCAGRRVDPGDAERRMREAGAEPQLPFQGSQVPWRCICLACGRTISPQYGSVAYLNQSACKYCAGNAVDAYEARQVMLSAHLSPQENYPGSDRVWPCVCLRCGDRVSPTYHNVSRGHDGCLRCAGQLVDVAFATTVMLMADLHPLVTYPGNDTPWKSRCLRCLEEVAPRYSGIRSGQGGCRSCANYGFDPTAPAFAYIVVSEAFSAVKIGVANEGSSRLREHARYGWHLHERNDNPSLWPCNTGRTALDLELDVLRWWRREKKAAPALEPGDMPQKGASETVLIEAIHPDETAVMIDEWYSRREVTKTQ